jgi:molybdenum cofactor biosynthesis protein B
LLAAGLDRLGFAVVATRVVPDVRDEIVAVLRSAVAAGADLVVTTGGTGLAPRDVTPEATREVIEREVPGLAEALRAAGREQVPTAVLSRGLAGVCGSTLVVNLPGSTGGVRDGVAVLGGVVGHAVVQLRGEGAHPCDARRPEHSGEAGRHGHPRDAGGQGHPREASGQGHPREASGQGHLREAAGHGHLRDDDHGAGP